MACRCRRSLSPAVLRLVPLDAERQYPDSPARRAFRASRRAPSRLRQDEIAAKTAISPVCCTSAIGCVAPERPLTPARFPAIPATSPAIPTTTSVPRRDALTPPKPGNILASSRPTPPYSHKSGNIGKNSGKKIGNYPATIPARRRPCIPHGDWNLTQPNAAPQARSAHPATIRQDFRQQSGNTFAARPLPSKGRGQGGRSLAHRQDLRQDFRQHSRRASPLPRTGEGWPQAGEGLSPFIARFARVKNEKNRKHDPG